MAKKFGIAVHLPDGQLGYLTANQPGAPRPALFETAEDAAKELAKRKRDKAYSWKLPVSVEPYVNRREKDNE